MQKLNLPSPQLSISIDGGIQYVFDIIRKKNIKLDPEEWVRQHFIHFLIEELGYAKSLLSCESGLKYNQLYKRTDILTYTNEMKPFLLVECKAPEIKVNQKVVEQASVYNKVIQAPYLVVTNGLVHYAFKIDHNKERFTQLNEIPRYQ